ncbi:PREDICTED: uncharacterized protein LOC105576565 isoform X2 [Cercocebus atys]|uniref:uncharacterized protein LOC105576565 isoform X2 n=1 Tax=Cercocebus atys TaxID=9531 RepID=UPI0005F4513F|nr:PREDICTED: uncharacterized protein LOC105576565 isoform X2 [Cercocebus atys]
MDNVGQKTLGLSRQALPSQHLEARGQVRPRVGGTPRQRPHPKPLCTPHSGPGHTSFLTVHPSFQQPQAGRTEEDSSPGPRDYSRGRCSLVLRITLHRLFRERQVLQDASASRALPIFAKTTAYAAPDGGSPPPHLPGLPPLPDGKLPLPFLSFQTWLGGARQGQALDTPDPACSSSSKPPLVVPTAVGQHDKGPRGGRPEQALDPDSRPCRRGTEVSSSMVCKGGHRFGRGTFPRLQELLAPR